jgi:hypothetical protein
MSGKTHVDKDLLKRRERGRSKADAQFFRKRDGVPLDPAPLLTTMNTLL